MNLGGAGAFAGGLAGGYFESQKQRLAEQEAKTLGEYRGALGEEAKARAGTLTGTEARAQTSFTKKRQSYMDAADDIEKLGNSNFASQLRHYAGLMGGGDSATGAASSTTGPNYGGVSDTGLDGPGMQPGMIPVGPKAGITRPMATGFTGPYDTNRPTFGSY